MPVLADGINEFVTACFTHLAEKHPRHHFIFIGDHPESSPLRSIKNASFISAASRSKNPLVWQFWYDYRLPAILKKTKADVLFNAFGIASMRTTIPQCLLLPAAAFTAQSLLLSDSQLRFFKKNSARFLEKAAKSFSFSSTARQALIEKWKLPEDKIQLVPPAVSEVNMPIDFEERESIKEKYTEGKEYFLYAGGLEKNNNLLALLKAYSFFKKRQKSNMQLLLLANNTDSDFEKMLKTFRFRKEVQVLTGLSEPEKANITAAAYCFVSAAAPEDYPQALLAAMQCGVPVICSEDPVLREYVEAAGLYCDPTDFEHIAEKMMRLYKDEDLHKKLAKAGLEKAAERQWEKTTGRIWELLTGK